MTDRQNKKMFSALNDYLRNTNQKPQWENHLKMA